MDIDLNTAPPVIPPIVTRNDRTSANEAIVEFEPQSIGSFEVTYYVANDSSTPYLVSKETVSYDINICVSLDRKNWQSSNNYRAATSDN